MPEPTDQIQVRPAVAQDAVPACHVLRHSVGAAGAPVADTTDAAACKELGEGAPERVRAWIESPDNFSVVAVNGGGEVVGFALIRRDGTLKLCYVLPDIHHHGAGSAMLQAVEHHAFDSWSLDAIQLAATDEARPFYEEHGYRVDADASDGTVRLVKPHP